MPDHPASPPPPPANTPGAPPSPPAPPRKPVPPRTSQGANPDRALLALVFFALLALGCYFLVRELRRDAAIQECVQRGRRNCDPDSPPVWER